MVSAAELDMPVTSGPYQGMASLDAWTYEDLKRDIQANGVILPIVVTQDGVIVDGHHRWSIATELGITDSVPVEVRSYASESAIEAEAIGLNALRRQMGKEERNRHLVRMRELGMTQEQVADRLGISQRRVGQIEDEDVEAISTSSSDQDAPRKRGGKYATRAESEKVQAKVAEMVAAGASVKEIAAALDISTSAAWQRRRKLPTRNQPTPLHEQIAECAARGMTSTQIAKEVGHGVEWVRAQSRRHNIDIPADRASYKKNVDTDAAMSRAIEHLNDALYAFKHIPMRDLDPEQTEVWACSLGQVATDIRTLIREIKNHAKEQDQS